MDCGKTVNVQRVVKVMVVILRVAVGAVFILSGFAKAVDPWGTVYKITDYVNMLGWQSLTPLVDFGAFALPVAEFLIGIFILFGLYRRFAPIALTAMMLVMTPLTLYLAVTDRMADCGCFGDVVLLTNWQTFWKNVVLLGCSTFLCRYNRRVKNLYGFGVQWMAWMLSMAFVIVVEYYGYFIQPLVDYRPFKVGTKLYDGPKYTDDDDDKFVFIYSKNGVKREFHLDSLPDDTWEYVDRRTVIPDEKPASEGMAIFDKGFDRTAELLDSESEQLMFVFPDLENISVSSTYLINELNEFAQERGVNTFGVTSGSYEQVNEWNDLSMAQYPMYEADDTDMKMLVRGNPAVVYMKDGAIKWKRTLYSIKSDKLQDATADMMSINADFDAEYRLHWLLGTYVMMMLLLLIANRMHVAAKFTIKSIRKNGKKAVTLQKEKK